MFFGAGLIACSEFVRDIFAGKHLPDVIENGTGTLNQVDLLDSFLMLIYIEIGHDNSLIQS